MFGALVILLLFAGFFEGTMDTLQFHFNRSVFRKFKNQLFWNPEMSWMNKYKDGDFSKGPRFPFSTTLFVGLTDGWHMAKTIRNLCLFVSLPILGYSIHHPISLFITIIIARALYGFGFWISYNKLLVSR